LLLILVLASPVLPWYGASLNGFAAGAGPGDPDLPAAGRQAGGVTLLGVIYGDASVHLNNQPVVPGMAVFQGDVIETGGASGAIVSFRSGASASLAKSSEVALEWESNTLNLRRGVLVVQRPVLYGTGQGLTRSASQWTTVHVLGATVIVQGEGEFPAICRIAALGGGAAVFNRRGHVEIYGAGAPFVLPSGQSARLEAATAAIGAAGAQAASQQAGKISKEIPEETVTRGKAAPVALKTEDKVYWQDLVTTLKNGRVQIALLDGSTLNVGARSELRVTRHDVDSGQTAIEMTVGKLRADVVKITKPTGSFQVKTNTAVIGVVGTSFIVFATLKNTQVTCLEGLVKVTSINPALAGTVILHAGQWTNVPSGLAPGGALQAPGSQVGPQIRQTTIGGPGAAPGAAGGIGTTGNAMNAGSAVANATTVGTSAAGAGAAGAAASSLFGASSDLTRAASSSNSATSAANSSTTSSTTTTTTNTTIIQSVVSPSKCGCLPPTG
jgi:hypothetical protein